jgi:hypothetical protein
MKTVSGLPLHQYVEGEVELLMKIVGILAGLKATG